MTLGKRTILALLVATAALSGGCNFVKGGSSTNHACDSIRRWIRGVKDAGAPASYVCADLSRYIFQSQVFTPELAPSANGEPESETQRAAVSFNGLNHEVAVAALLFSTQQAYQSDPEAKNFPEMYDRTEYQVGFRGDDGKSVFSKSADSLNQALAEAAQECHRRLGE